LPAFNSSEVEHFSDEVQDAVVANGESGCSVAVEVVDPGIAVRALPLARKELPLVPLVLQVTSSQV